VAIIRVLLVGCGGQPLAIPLTRVLRTLELPATAIAGEAHRRIFQLDDEEIELVGLAERLGLVAAADSDSLCVVLIEAQGRRVGLQVDRFCGQREAFVKTLGFPLDRLPGMSGATIEADGSVVFIIDPHPLLAGLATSGPARYEENPHAFS
jgi:two-component system chemotaxis sensor kinase CheA